MNVDQCILGCLLIENNLFETILEKDIQRQDFSDWTDRKIFEIISSLISDSKPADILTVSKKDSSIDKVYISSLVDNIPDISNFDEYCDLLKRDSAFRAIRKVGSNLSKISGKAELDDCLSYAESQFRKIRGRFSSNHSSASPEYINQVIENIRSGDSSLGLETGFQDFDHLIGSGLEKGKILIIAGRPSMGKSSFGTNIMVSISVHRDIPSGIISLEMSREELGLRIVSQLSGISATAIKNSNVGDAGWKEIEKQTKRFRYSPLYIKDDVGSTFASVSAACRSLVKNENVECIFIDYLQLMSAGRASNREQEVSGISRGMKLLAMELGIPLIIASQLSRASEGRPGKRPVLSDLRESGAIEQDADIVAFVFRPSFYTPGKPSKSAEIIISKNRGGDTGTIPMKFDGKTTTFTEAVPFQSMVSSKKDIFDKAQEVDEISKSKADNSKNVDGWL